MKKIDEKVLQDIFDVIVHHFEFMEKECLFDISFIEFRRYLVGARYALCVAFNLDYDSCILISDFFDKKINEYFGGKESE